MEVFSVFSLLASFMDQNLSIVIFSMNPPSCLSGLSSHGGEGAGNCHRHTTSLLDSRTLSLSCFYHSVTQPESRRDKIFFRFDLA